MSRATNNSASRQRRNKTLRMAKGYRGGRSKLNRTAQETVNRALAYAYRDRRVKKRVFRQLWITRINAAARMHGMSYSRFMAGLKAAAVEIDRKVLADLAVHDEAGFARLAEIAKQQNG
jgi:large subunit ribosomal protein L20